MPIIYLLFFLFIYNNIKRTRHKFDVACYINWVYLVSVICFTILYYFYPKEILYIDRINFESVTAHVFLLSLFIAPFVIHSPKIDIGNFHISDKGLTAFSWCIIVPSLLAIIISLFDVVSMIAFGNYELARNAYVSGDIDAGYIRRYGYFGYFLSLGPQTCFIAVSMFFYLFFYKGMKKLGLLMFIASFSLVVQNLAIAGREGFIRWLLYFGFNFFLFRQYLSYKPYKSFWNFIALSIVVMFVFFSAITQDRFEDSSKGPLYSIINYAGQPFYNFSYQFHVFRDMNTRGFTSILTLIGGNEHAENAINYADFALNTFPTFVGSFINKIGFYRTALFGIIWFVILNFIFGKKRKFDFTLFITYITLCDIILIGVLYFIHYPRFTQITMLVYIILASVLSAMYPQKKSKQI